jgi:twitching motility protein PilT
MNPNELLNKILKYSSENNYPDIHLNTGNKPYVRDKNGEILLLSDNFPVLDKIVISEFIKIISSLELFEKFEKNFELDVSYSYENGSRYRTNCYIDTSGYNIAMRLIPEKIPTLEEL